MKCQRGSGDCGGCLSEGGKNKDFYSSILCERLSQEAGVRETETDKRKPSKRVLADWFSFTWFSLEL